MNCKPGDLAVIVRSYAGNHGALLTVLGPVLGSLPGGMAYPGCGHLWHCRSTKPLYTTSGYFETEMAFPDSHLRPIRDNPGEDETLQWAPVPGEKVTA